MNATGTDYLKVKRVNTVKINPTSAEPSNGIVVTAAYQIAP
ncbi:hypothetical protein [Lysinibacillus sp. LZ02]